MSADRASTVVAGESRADLLVAVGHFRKTRSGPDGGMRIEADLPGEVAVPLVRALMRIEAELLLREADLFAVGVEPRSPEERQTEALCELFNRLHAGNAALS